MKVVRTLVGVVVLGTFGTSAAQAMDRVESLVNSFQVFCTLELPQFSRMDAKATAMKLPVVEDMGKSQASGPFAHAKSWGVMLTDGPHTLTASEANGPNGYVNSCGIAAGDPDGQKMKDVLVKNMRLGKPVAEVVAPDGQMKTTTWQIGPDGLVIVRDATPASKPGVHMLIMYKAPPKP